MVSGARHGGRRAGHEVGACSNSLERVELDVKLRKRSQKRAHVRGVRVRVCMCLCVFHRRRGEMGREV